MSDIVYVMEPPKGEHRTVVNPPSSGDNVIPAGIALTCISFVCVALRVFTRTYVVKGVLGLDDYLVMIAIVFAFAFLATAKHLYDIGGGNHMWDIPFSYWSPGFQQTTIGATMTYALPISFSKLSILTFYLRISPDRKFRMAVYILIGIVVAYTITYVLLFTFKCSPVAAGWDLVLAQETNAKCIGNLIPMMTLSVANILIDLVILCLPIKVVVPLQIPRRQKFSLIFLFATGGFVCAAAIKRTVIMIPLLAAVDYTWELSDQFIWSFLEVNAGIVCASVPALKPLFMRYLPFLLASKLGSSNQPSGYAGGYASSNTNDGLSKNRNVYGNSYELPSRDELPEGVSRSQDDETRLWPTKNGQTKTTADLKNDSDSMESVADQYPGRVTGGAKVTSGGYNRSPEPNGIKVTKDTFVSYGP